MEFLARILPLALWPFRALSKAAPPTLAEQWAIMTPGQKAVLQWAYEQGTPHGFGQTMRAIAWQESSAGADLENPEDKGGGSWGIFGTSALSAWHRLNGWLTPYTEADLAAIAERLKNEPVLAAKSCHSELRYWQDVHGADRWSRIWASYNAGNEWEKGEDYAKAIQAKIRFLRTVITE